MSKSLAYFCLVVIALGIMGVDALVLSQTDYLAHYVREKLKSVIGDSLQYDKLNVGFTGRLSITNVALHATTKKLRVLSADRVELQVSRKDGNYVPEFVTLISPRITLNDEFFAEVSASPAGRPLRELYPPDALPRIRCKGGQFEVIHSKILNWQSTQTFAIEDLALVPVSGYRYFAGGRLKSALLGTWLLSGEFDLDTGAVHASFASEDVTLSPDVRAILAPKIQGDWDDYRPDGTARVRIQVDAEPGQPATFRATVEPTGMRISYKGFPYLVQDARGQLDFFSDHFEIKNLMGRSGNTIIRVDGRAGGYAAESDLEFRVDIKDMPLDDKLRAALKPDARKVFDQFRPTGTLDAHGLVVRDFGPDKPVRNPLNITFRNASFRYLPFPYELTDVEGEIFLESPFVRVMRIAGTHAQSRLTVSGVLDNLDDDPVVDLRIRGEDVQMDATLKHALPEDVRKMWERFSPSGAIDIDWRVTKKKGEKDKHHGDVVAKAGRVTFRDVPLPVADVAGYVTYDPAEIRLSNLAGKLDQGTVSVDGVITPTENGYRHHYDIAVVGARVDERFRRAMPKSVSAFLDTLKLSGLIDFKMRLECDVRSDGEDLRWEIRINLRRATIEAGVKFEDIEGTIDFIGTMKDGKTIGSGPVRFDVVRISGKKITDLAASLSMDGDKVIIKSIRGTAYSGLVTGELTLDSQTTDMAGELRVDRMELREFVRDTENYANRVLAGKVNFEILDIKGKGNDTKTLTGRGSMTITDGQLFEVPGIAQIFSGPFAESRRFKAGTIVFDIERRKFKINSMGFEAPNGATLTGRGSLDFDGNYDVRVKLSPAPILGIDFFLFKIPGALLQELFRTRIEGNMNSETSKKSDAPEEPK